MSITAQRLQAVLDAGLFYQRRVGALRNAISAAAGQALASGLVDPTIHGLLAEFMTPEWVGQEHGHSRVLTEEAVRVQVNAKDNARRARQRARQEAPGPQAAQPPGSGSSRPPGRYLTDKAASVAAPVAAVVPPEDPDEGGQMEEWMTAKAKWQAEQGQRPDGDQSND